VTKFVRGIAWSVGIAMPITLLCSWLPMLWAHGAAYHVSEIDARWPETPRDGWPTMPDSANRVSVVWGARIESAAHNLRRLAETRRQDPTIIVHWMSRWEYGVPFCSMSRVAMSIQAGRTITPEPLTIWQTGLCTPTRFQNGLAAREFIPLRPIWPALIANWLIFSVLAWGAMAGLARMRFRRRTCRGQCVGCAYPLAGLARCPECGAARRVS